MSRDTMRKILAFAVIMEIGTGFALLLDPALVVALLAGGDIGGAGVVAARCFGIALVALGVACWRGRQPAENVAAAVLAMPLANAAIALYLAYLGAVVHLGAPLLWPAVVIHAVVAALLAAMGRREGKTAATDN